jgi:hypothetical protein
MVVGLQPEISYSFVFMRVEQDILWYVSSVVSVLNYSRFSLVQHPQDWTGGRLSSILYCNAKQERLAVYTL